MSKTTPIWDTLLQGALVFDGTGELPQPLDIAIKDGRIVAKGSLLDAGSASSCVDVSGQWLMPGLLDIHTHLDLEVDLEPGLPEVVRHGTTTVLVGNCSLGTCFGKQDEGDQNPIVDCFTRVENIPKPVLQKCVDNISWDSTAGYVEHFESLALGPNIGAFVPHSMLRIEVMGVQASVSREPSEAELQQMTSLLSDAMDQGYLGMSTDGLPFHYMANDPNKEKRIPTQFAKFGELKRLLKVVRERDGVWQTTPILEQRAKAFGYFALTSGRLFGKTLKTSALSAIEFALLPKASKLFLNFAKLMNSAFFKGNMHFQALGSNFRIWSDGIVSPLYEEMEWGAKLIAKEYDDTEGRKALLNDPAFIEGFREEWRRGRYGNNFAHWKAKMGMPDSVVVRDLAMMMFDDAPIADWNGQSLQQVYDRVQQFQSGRGDVAASDEEKNAFELFPNPINTDADFFMHLLREYDKGFRYWIDVANVGNHATLDLLLDENTLPGFNDSGAHITNMAFFDANLMGLKLAQQRSMATVAQLVKRLTREPAQFFGLDVGTLDIGAQADITIIDPQALAAHDSNDGRQLIYRELLAHQQLVNRSDDVVTRVLINGECAWSSDDSESQLGKKRLGRFVKANGQSVEQEVAA